MKIIFAGTPEFSVSALQSLLASQHDVVAVYCQPDRPSGRGRKLKIGPVKSCAQSHGIPVFQPTSLKDADVQQAMQQHQADLMVVVAYGLILPAQVLRIPRLGCLNIHASLLPRWRGAAPIQRAILAGDTQTGITIMQMDEGLDTGDMIYKQSCNIGAMETAGQLHDRLSQLGAQAIIDAIALIESGEARTERQSEQDACYAAKLDKAEANIDWSKPAIEIHRQIRAFNPWPVAQTRWQEKTLRIWEADVDPQYPLHGEEPGTVIKAGKDTISVATSAGVLHLLKVQLPGGKPMSVNAFLNAHTLSHGRLG